MAYDDDDLPSNWAETERELFDDVLGGEPEILADSRLQMDFHAALFDHDLDAETRAQFYDDLVEHLFAEYGIDFEHDFDWEAYREWYEAA